MKTEILKFLKKMGLDVKEITIEDVREHPVLEYDYVFGQVVVGGAVLSFKFPKALNRHPVKDQ